MANGISKKQMQADQRRAKRMRAAGLPQGAATPPRAIVPSAAPRPPAGLPEHRYPAKRSSLGERQVPMEAVAPLGKADK
jgi:hypothetical protein